jgi:hypothetical protein
MNDSLNFHSAYETHVEPTRIRDCYIQNGHVTDEPIPTQGCTNWPRLCKSELQDQDEMVNLYARRIRDNLHHDIEFSPCTIFINGVAYTQEEWEGMT